MKSRWLILLVVLTSLGDWPSATDLANSSQLESLLRAGRLYLSLMDCILLDRPPACPPIWRRCAPAWRTLDRTRALAGEGVLSQQALDDAQAKYDSAAASAASLEKAYELVRIGPRQEEIDAMRAQVRQAQGTVDYAQTQLDNTVIRAPISGTILERNVEKGEFVTTGFVGDKGAKGYVVSLADLNDLQVELDISQNDFAKLGPRQAGIVTTDAYPDRKYKGYIEEIAPEANRQKATVQVKVKIAEPDDYLRPEMNASVAFVSNGKAVSRLSKKERMDHASTALRLAGLGDRLGHLPRQLSGGQEQRVAIARAIVTDPDLILADEPTGNSDAASAQDVLTLLSKLNREYDKTIVMVTHDPHAARFATKVRHLEKGALLPEGQASPPAGAVA